jgi:hypothetical protein
MAKKLLMCRNSNENPQIFPEKPAYNEFLDTKMYPRIVRAACKLI